MLCLCPQKNTAEWGGHIRGRRPKILIHPVKKCGQNGHARRNGLDLFATLTHNPYVLSTCPGEVGFSHNNKGGNVPLIFEEESIFPLLPRTWEVREKLFLSHCPAKKSIYKDHKL